MMLDFSAHNIKISQKEICGEMNVDAEIKAVDEVSHFMASM